jgi:hypothetical protein
VWIWLLINMSLLLALLTLARYPRSGEEQQLPMDAVLKP